MRIVSVVALPKVNPTDIHTTDIHSYRSYRELPPIAGICTVADDICSGI